MKKFILALSVLLLALVATAPANARYVSSDGVWGVNGVTVGQDSELYVAKNAGVGFVRVPMCSTDTQAQDDATVNHFAENGLAVYAVTGVCGARTGNVFTDAYDEGVYLQALYRRYGPGGTYWSQNPGVPQHWIVSYEVGNEENNGDESIGLGLAYSPTLYAGVYGVAYTYLHNMSCFCRVVVGGLLDQGQTNPDSYLDALKAGGHQVDAVGWHEYVGNDLTYMENDTGAFIRYIANNHIGGGKADDPQTGNAWLDANEFDAVRDSYNWPSIAASYMNWLDCGWVYGSVGEIAPFWWGETPDANTTNPWAVLVNANGSISNYGLSWLTTVRGQRRLRLRPHCSPRTGPLTSVEGDKP
jgi:hypothetical protein